MAATGDQTEARRGTVVLLSGGIESSTLLHQEAAARIVYPLFVDYGQRAARREVAAADAQTASLGLSLKSLDMSRVGEGFREGRERSLHVPLPHRNLPILALALSYAAQVGAARISLALNADDLQTYRSAGRAFMQAFRALAATLEPVEVVTPLEDLSKAQIIREGYKLDVDYAQTYSCLLGYPLQCGACPQCRKRRAAFTAAGLEDPAGYQRPAARTGAR